MDCGKYLSLTSFNYLYAMDCGKYLSLTSFNDNTVGNYIYISDVKFKNEKWLKEDLLERVKSYVKLHSNYTAHNQLMLEAITNHIFEPNTIFLIKYSNVHRQNYRCEINKEFYISFKHDESESRVKFVFISHGHCQLSVDFVLKRGRKNMYWVSSY